MISYLFAKTLSSSSFEFSHDWARRGARSIAGNEDTLRTTTTESVADCFVSICRRRCRDIRWIIFRYGSVIDGVRLNPDESVTHARFRLYVSL